MRKPRIVVVGSSNIDMVVKAERIPRGGETVLGGDFVMVPGGKGANQAVCAAKLGADVTLVARVGRDVFGQTSLANFRSVGVDTEFVRQDPDKPSGVALIAVDAAGENAIVVAPGANHALSCADVDRAADAIKRADVLVLQLEIPMETGARAIDLARDTGTPVVLNPAPMRPVERDMLGKVDVLVPNEHEAAGLLGRAGEAYELDPEAAAKEFLALGVSSVVVTLGAKGAYVAGPDAAGCVEPMRVSAVDTTAAGDAFTGALVCALAEGQHLMDAARFASRVAAISVTRLGAQPSMPSREEVAGYVFGN